MTEYLYQKDFDSLECECPYEAVSEARGTMYRIVHQDLSHQNIYLPPGKIKPARVLSEKNCRKKCELLALSFFTTKSAAKSKLDSLLQKAPQLKKVIGDCVGKVVLTPDDGDVSKEPKRKHINLYEGKGVNLQHRIQIVE